LYHFRSHVLKGAAKCAPELEYGSKSKITKFGVVVLSDEYVLGFDIPVHEIVLMQVVYSFADVAEVPFDQLLAELAIAELYFLVQRPPRGKLKHHEGHILFLLVVVIQQFYDVWVVELVVDVDFFLGVFVIDLNGTCLTVLIATTSPFYILRANLTYPYDPNPTISTLPTSFLRN
jgi:hypothetical protein